MSNWQDYTPGASTQRQTPTEEELQEIRGIEIDLSDIWNQLAWLTEERELGVGEIMRTLRQGYAHQIPYLNALSEEIEDLPNHD